MIYSLALAAATLALLSVPVSLTIRCRTGAHAVALSILAGMGAVLCLMFLIAGI